MVEVVKVASGFHNPHVAAIPRDMRCRSLQGIRRKVRSSRGRIRSHRNSSRGRRWLARHPQYRHGCRSTSRRGAVRAAGCNLEEGGQGIQQFIAQALQLAAVTIVCRKPQLKPRRCSRQKSTQLSFHAFGCCVVPMKLSWGNQSGEICNDAMRRVVDRAFCHRRANSIPKIPAPENFVHQQCRGKWVAARAQCLSR